MAKNVDKILKQSQDAVYIAESTAGAEPTWASAHEVGFSDGDAVTLEGVVIPLPEGGGAVIQQNTQYNLKANFVQILDTALRALKNKNCWILIKPKGTVSATKPEIKIKNFLLNVVDKIETKKDGKSVVMVTATKAEDDSANAYAFVTSATSIA